MSDLSNITLGLSLAKEIAMFAHGKNGTILYDKRLVTWDVLRLVVDYMQANNLDRVESWFPNGDKYELTLTKKPFSRTPLVGL